MKKQLLITYDYELFLGNRSGSADECLIQPTEQTLAVLEKYKAKAVFFVDTTYLLQLKKKIDEYAGCKKDFEKVTAQIKQLISAGHYVYPHLHPHWLDAEYLAGTNEWRLNKIEKYRFHNITASEKQFVFDESVQLLKEIIHPVAPGYEVDCYRAGGWCIQPFEDFKMFFIKNNFKYDMSVIGGFYQFSSAQYFDFSMTPKKDIYHFEDDVTVEKTNGRFTEFNISSLEIKNSTRFFDKAWLKYIHKIKGDHTFNKGQGQASVANDMQQPAAVKGHDILNSKKERIAVELLTLVKLPAYLKFIHDNNYMQFISHPKMLTQHNHKIFDRFLKKVFGTFEVETDFKKMTV
ncbi:MAG: hypothetical protein ABIT08_01650 [Bacteroidia bacterium]